MRNASYGHIITMFCILCFGMLRGQDGNESILLAKALNQLTSQHNIQFNYESNLLEGIKIRPLSKNRTLDQKLKNIENQTSLRFSRVGKLVITITKAFTICGYVKDVQFKVPLIGATIQGKSSSTVSNEDGFFELEVSSAKEEITVDYLGYKPIKRAAVFFDTEQCSDVQMYEQQQVLSPVTLTGYLVKGIDKKADGSTAIEFSKFTLLPGLIEADVLQTVQALPGIQSIDETVSNINIRGGSHDQNLILWDDIKMYKTGHFFGLISSFNPQITKTALVITNGTDVSYTDGVSGTIHMQTDKRLQTKFKGNIGINLISADAFADIPLGTKSSLQIAGRRSLDDVVRTPIYENYFDRIVQETEVQENENNVLNTNQGFTFYDTSFRWLYQPSEKDAIRVNFILLNNTLDFDETATIGQSLQTRQSSLLQYNIAGAINYRREWSDTFTTELNIYETDYKLRAINSNVLNEQRFLQENIVSETGLRLEGILNKNPWQYKMGYHLVESEVTNVNDIDRPRFRRLNSDVMREHALVGQVNHQNKEKGFNLRSGVRVNYIDKFDLILVEPRLSLRKKVGNHLELEVLGEFKHQNISQIINFQNDFLGIEKRRWQQTDNDSIPILRSKQVSMGVAYNNKGWLLDVKGYYKTVAGITTQSQAFTTKYEFTRVKGRYEVAGLDFLMRKKYGNMNTWLSYSFMDNEYTFDVLEEIQFPSNFDITHSLTIGSTYSNESWNISAGLNYRSGNPTSVPEVGNEVIDDDINFDFANNTRLADYLRVDMSMLYKWQLTDDFRTEIGASVWNMLNRENTINNFYRVGANEQANQFSRFSLGLTTNFMVRFYF